MMLSQVQVFFFSPPDVCVLTEMSETSSDAESSCGWTIISNEV